MHAWSCAEPALAWGIDLRDVAVEHAGSHEAQANDWYAGAVLAELAEH